ncbi:TonB-dependent receptor [Aliiglaciecola sp. CAU 1673]|uniref:TonB-dependent receptor n=1 Tax=Aliiglaciecola sp. CAU 1673 TaxID=3032595 RepID=UPI0023D983FB|nr:TonB-dependent receptor [Aliiglaciecola sp. CAU 1673]MDF2177036.1 TonB-dependent receptor [Aliiglaciecola sp. CAU 1673]
MGITHFRKAAVSVSVALACCGQVSIVYAQDGADNTDNTEIIAVTGSRIKRQGDTPSPVQELNLEDLNQTGSVSLGEVLQELPSVGASLNSNGSAGTSHGSSSLNLRNLGENRSLVLVNGHRWVNGAGTRGFRDFVDLNTIPQAIVKRVEVLQDGATAIYGADAIAGVVNIYTHSDFVGTSAKAYYGQSSEGDRETVNVDLLWGQDVGESNIMFAASYADQKPIYTQDRELTAVPLNGLSDGTPEGLFRESGLAAVLGFPIPSAGITRDPGSNGNDLSSWRAVTGEDQFNRYYNNYVTGPNERYALYGQAIIPLDDRLNFRIEALYNKRESDQQFSSALSSVRGGSRGFMIANDPRVNPFGIPFSGSDFRHTSFMEENGYRVNAQEVETTRLGLGLDGELNIGDGWDWDTFLSYGKNKADFTSNNQVHLDKLALGLRACDTTGITADVTDLAAGCVPVNLFNTLTAEMVDYINFTGRDYNEAKQLDFTFNITGSLYSLPAGDLAVAAGIEYREEQGLDVPDSTINSDPRVNTYQTTSSSARTGTDGEYDLKEAYVEFVIPLLDGESWADKLELSLATRYSDYSTFGSTTNSKAGIVYAPVDGFTLRATWAEGFRAPSILELYEGQRQTFAPVLDPCSSNKSLVGCSSVPASYTQGETNVQLTTGGNRFLQPETSENWSYGMVYIPDFIEDFSVTLDWYDIEIDNTISIFGAQAILDLCATKGKNCEVITRSASGEIEDIIDGPVNLNSTKVSGVDMVMNYGLETEVGEWDFNLNISKLRDFEVSSTLSDGTVQVEDRLGVAMLREAYPEWRSSFSTNWSQGQWKVNYNLRHIGDTTETVDPGTPDEMDRHIGTVIYHNASVAYDIDDNLAVKLGINNIGDKQPPISLTNPNINFDQNTYNPVGRFMYLQVSYQM